MENVKGIWRGCRRVGREKNERNLLSRQQVVVMLPGKWNGGRGGGWKLGIGRRPRERRDERERDKEPKGEKGREKERDLARNAPREGAVLTDS